MSAHVLHNHCGMLVASTLPRLGRPALEQADSSTTARREGDVAREPESTRVRFSIPAIELEPLFTLAAGDQLTALISAWATLLSRYSGDPQSRVVVVGTCECEPGVSDNSGAHANAVPLTIDLTTDPTFPELCEGLRRAWAAAARQPKSEHNNPPFGPPALCTHIRLTVESIEGVFVFELEHDTMAMDADTGRRLPGYFRQLCHSLAADPGRPVGAAPAITRPELDQLVTQWNATERPYPNTTILEVIAAQARRRPNAVAIRSVSGDMSYAALLDGASLIARQLRERGVHDESFVGVWMERSPELVVALLGISAAGAAYVPLDPDLPEERLRFMVEDCGLRFILADDSTVPFPIDESIVILDVTATMRCETPPEPTVLPIVAPDQLAYLMYTSGSTGRPKGVLLEHRAVHNRLLWAQDTFVLDERDRVLQKTPYSFDVSVWEFFWPLMYGASIVVAQPGVHKDPYALAQMIRAFEVTVTHFVPSMLDVFLDSDPGPLPSLRLVLSSGEALAPPIVRRFLAGYGAELHNLYGPTEAAVDVSHWPCSLDDATAPIGRPISNVALYVLDSAGNPQPPGLVGELHVGGVCLARGYHGRPELTRQKFVEPANGLLPHRRLYRTGDLALFRPDGALEYLGRIDDQIKLRGFRVEPGEIEACLREQTPALKSVAVVPVVAPSGATKLVAYYVAEDTLDEIALIKQSAKILPDYMVPARLVRLPSLPLTTSGKLDRRALSMADVASLQAPPSAT